MFPRFLILLLGLISAASAQHLGDSQEEIVAQNGAPIEANHAKETAVYRRGPWKIEIAYANEIAKKLTITKLDPLTDEDIQSILAANAAGATWHELQINGSSRIWQRSDLATARCDRVKPRSIELINSPYPKTQAGAVGAASAAVAQTLLLNALPAPSASRTLRATSATPAAAPSATPGPSSVAPVSLPQGSSNDGLRKMLWDQTVEVFAFVALPLLLLKILVGGLRSRSHKSSTLTPPPLPQAVGADASLVLSLDDISWENFELLTGEIFRRQGYEVEINSGLGPDGGKDLTLRRDGETVLVQCKCFAAGNKVPVVAMREFFGLIKAEEAQRGIFVTTGLYSRDATEFAEGKPIELLGRAAIERMMESVSRPGENLCDMQSWVDDFAAASRIADPACPRCRNPMKLKRGVTGGAFWGCSSYPRCRGKREARTELVRAFSYQSAKG